MPIDHNDRIAELDATSQIRQLVKSNKTCLQRFEEAQTLCISLFDADLAPRPKAVIPFFTDHSASHFIQIENFINKILFGASGEAIKFSGALEPTAEEAMYLLSAVWLHDIGMISGILPGDSVGPDTDWKLVRDRHEMRTADYLCRYWQQNCTWSDIEKDHLAELCIHHRRRHELKDMELNEVDGRMGRVRLRDLAAVLRLADACHADVTRVPNRLLNLYRSIGIPLASRSHLGRPQLIRSIQFNQQSKEIRLICQVPRQKKYGTTTVDFSWVVDKVAASIAEELASVEPFLVRYSNTAFHKVVPEILRPAAQADPSMRMCELWPDLLASVHSASETACMLAALVLAHIETSQAKTLPQTEIQEILAVAKAIHKFNILVINLCERIESDLKKPVEHLKGYLEQYLRDRAIACNVSAEVASQKVKIDPDDWLVVYGFSHSVMTLFTKHLRSHRGRVLIVECRPRTGGIVDEADRVHRELKDIGLDCKYVRLESLPLIFAHANARSKKQRIVVLLGTRGIYNGGGALCLVGNASIALAAQKEKIIVYVIAEPEKRTRDKDIERVIAQDLRNVALESASHTSPDWYEIRPEIDVLLRDQFTLIMDDGGTGKSEQEPIPAPAN